MVYKDFLEVVEFEAGFGRWGEFISLGEGSRVSVQGLVRSQDSHTQLCGMCTAQLQEAPFSLQSMGLALLEYNLPGFM